ncbi:hypothetical protein AAFF_G00227920 [Aldrovandia affinis]|uniref:Secretory carrier-associated membrane protein n=1 Tax=Aldrovandia affinis TaxID=143900 RepID=A0AAD7TBL7_9TELE|nr:hypothetical protein AAFF_G00227920 [Aldrovandia affinis]
MSGFDNNPFAGPMDVNPFQDPSVTEVTTIAVDRVEEFNPFDSTTLNTQTATTIPAPTTLSQPAVLQASEEPSPQATVAAAQADLLRQQEELERKAAELDRKEQDLQRRAAPTGASGRENNWPPLPKIFPIKPCFYQDFEEEIPLDYQRVCKMMYYLWIDNGELAVPVPDVLACLAYFTTDPVYGVDFGLAILWFLLFCPTSFLCWYRPVYKAFKSDSSFSFFFFFFVFFFQVAVYIIQSVGIPKWGNSGWIASIAMIRSNLAVAVVMMVVAGFFTVCAVLSIILLKMVHAKYRRTGASFQKAQNEFSQGVLTNRSFQNTAASVASTAAQGAFQRN